MTYSKQPNPVYLYSWYLHPMMHSISGEMQAGLKHGNEKVLEEINLYLCPVMLQDIVYWCCNYVYCV